MLLLENTQARKTLNSLSQGDKNKNVSALHVAITKPLECNLCEYFEDWAVKSPLRRTVRNFDLGALELLLNQQSLETKALQNAMEELRHLFPEVPM